MFNHSRKSILTDNVDRLEEDVTENVKGQVTTALNAAEEVTSVSRAVCKVSGVELVELVSDCELQVWDSGVLGILPATLRLIKRSTLDSTVDLLQDGVVDQKESSSGIKNRSVACTRNGLAVQRN